MNTLFHNMMYMLSHMNQLRSHIFDTQPKLMLNLVWQDYYQKKQWVSQPNRNKYLLFHHRQHNLQLRMLVKIMHLVIKE